MLCMYAYIYSMYICVYIYICKINLFAHTVVSNTAEQFRGTPSLNVTKLIALTHTGTDKPLPGKCVCIFPKSISDAWVLV